ncbi:MAG: hypothetical protein LBQ88_04595 [Treponema sp.]|jgi:hypothetical protein|nr:hypothetical protein [Treponema sp.]
MAKVKGMRKKKAIAASNRRFAARRLAGLMYTLLKKEGRLRGEAFYAEGVE